MSGELDVLISVKVMGLMHDADGKIFNPPGTLYYWHTERTPAAAELLPYSTDLNACARAEQRVIELGKGNAYAAELWAMLVLRPEGDSTEYHLTRAVTASAEARCQAMLSVLEAAQ